MMNNLIPEDAYLRLRNIPERDLNPNEWVLIHVWEILSPWAKENKTLKLENACLREDVKLTTEKHKQLITELSHYQKLLCDKDDDYKRFSMNYETSRRGLEAELKKAYEEVRGLRGEGLEVEGLRKELRKVGDECEF